MSTGDIAPRKLPNYDELNYDVQTRRFCSILTVTKNSVQADDSLLGVPDNFSSVLCESHGWTGVVLVESGDSTLKPPWFRLCHRGQLVCI